MMKSKKIAALLLSGILFVPGHGLAYAEELLSDGMAVETVVDEAGDPEESFSDLINTGETSAQTDADTDETDDASNETGNDDSSDEEIFGGNEPEEDLQDEEGIGDKQEDLDDELDEAGNELPAVMSAGPVYGMEMHGDSSELVAVSAVNPSRTHTNCKIYAGANIEGENYVQWAAPIRSYLFARNDGTIMRVQAGAIEGKLLVEYMDTDFNLKSDATLDLDLPLFGGFFDSGDAYYLLTGQTNWDESNELPVIRITKYSHDWAWLGSADLKGANTVVPFSAGTARFAMSGKYLLVRTCHEMYASTDGLNHQANVTVMIDTSNMTITDSFYDIANIGYGYVSHSFNQFVLADDNRMVTIDHGDAYPRSIVLCRYAADLGSGRFSDSMVQSTDILSFPGNTGENYTGGSVGGFENSDSCYLIAGNYDVSWGDYSKRNIYVASVPRDGTAVTMRWFTDYASQSGTGSTPHLIKTGANNFLLMWYDGNGNVLYTQINGTGERTSQIYSMPGNLSDCKPAIINGKVTWYTWNNDQTMYYTIQLSDLAVHDAVLVQGGHVDTYGPVQNGEVDATCTVCGRKTRFAVPTGITVWWKLMDTERFGEDSWFSGGITSDLHAGQYVDMMMEPVFSSSLTDRLGNLEVSVSDPSVIEYRIFEGQDQLRVLKQGVATVTIYPACNPGVKVEKTFFVDTLHDENIYSTDQKSEYVYSGAPYSPELEVYFQDVKLTKGTDYNVTYENNVNAGTGRIILEGKGIYTGKAYKDFTISQKSLENSMINIIPAYTYTGNAIEPVPAVKYNGKTLVKDKDYTVSYSQNVNSGDYASVIVNGKGNFTGSANRYFSIQKKEIEEGFVGNLTDQNYTGQEIKPEPAVTWSNKNLRNGTDYSLSYEKNVNPGIAVVTVKGKGNYTGSVKRSFIIIPPATSITNLIEKGTGRLRIEFQTKGTAVNGYQIRYSLDKNMKTGVKTASTTNRYIYRKGLVGGKTYYVGVRTYKTINGKKRYSAWSATKSIKLIKLPQTTGIKTLTKVSTGFTAKFIQRTYVGGYQIRYSKDPTYKTKKTASRTGAANTSITRKGLAKGTWYVSVRTFNIAANGTKYYSAWSSSKKIVVK